MTDIKRPAKRGEYAFGCNECGPFAWWRPCFQPGKDKGNYVSGRGYTHYYDHPSKVCMTRLLHGCPGDWWSQFESKDGSTHLQHERIPPSFTDIAAYIEGEVSPRIPQNQKRLFKLTCEALRLANRYVAEFTRKDG